MMDKRRIWEVFRKRVRQPDALTGIFVALWCLVWLDAQIWFWLPQWFHALAFLSAAPTCAYWIRRHKSVIHHRAVLSITYIPAWQFIAHVPLVFSAYSVSSSLSAAGAFGAFFIGLAWAVWWIDPETKRMASTNVRRRTWDPRRLAAWYLGKKNPRLRQSAFTLLTYILLFGLISLVLTRMTGCSVYEAPLGGGEQKQLRQVVQIQKVIKKK